MIPAFTNFKPESTEYLNKSINEYNKEGKTLQWTFSGFPDGFTMNNIGPAFSKFLDTDMGEAAQMQALKDMEDALDSLNQ